MTLYFKPWYYTFSHILTGFVAVWFPIIGLFAVIYQLQQYVLNIRVFIVEREILEGNSLQHTFLKLSEMAIGYIIGYLMRNNALNKV